MPAVCLVLIWVLGSNRSRSSSGYTFVSVHGCGMPGRDKVLMAAKLCDRVGWPLWTCLMGRGSPWRVGRGWRRRRRSLHPGPKGSVHGTVGSQRGQGEVGKGDDVECLVRTLDFS